MAALYQDDIVEEDDIRTWYASPASRGDGQKPGPLQDNIEKCRTIGSHMIQQFDDQESEEESEDEED